MSDHTPSHQRWQAAIDSEPGRHTSILSEVRGNQFHITFNRPARYNAFTTGMYERMINLLIYANEYPEVKFIVLRGSGGNYSSGNDLSNFTNPHYENLAGTVQEKSGIAAKGLQKFTATILNSTKPIFALVEGKVIGFAFTQLFLYDRVFAVDGAEFNAPLVQLAQGPEMCASYTFPKVFGRAVGEDLLVKGTKVNASFLEKYGLASRHGSAQLAEAALQKHLGELDELEWNSYLSARKLFRDIERPVLHQSNKQECTNLIQRWSSPDLPAHLMQYMVKVKAKSKL